MIDAGARCAVHPETPAFATCFRCGTYACSSCAVTREDTTMCLACARRSPLGASWLAVAAVILAFLGVGCVPLAPVGFVLASVDLTAVVTGRSPKESTKLDALALVLAVLALVVWGLVIRHHVLSPDAPMYDMPE